MAVGSELTKKFMQKWETGDPEMRKQAIYAVNSYVRFKLRENGIVRSPLLPPLDIAPGQLDKDQDPTVLKKFMEIEPDSTATSVPFRGTAELRLVKGKFVPVYFEKLESQMHVVNKFELMNYSNDLRAIIDEQDVKNIQEQEDTAFINQATKIVQANPTQQDIELFGGLTKNNWASAQQAFPIDKPIKWALMNTNTFKEIYKWDYVRDMGFGQYGSEVFANGTLPTINGVTILKTIKKHLVPDGYAWFFAPEDFIGKFLSLVPPTTYVEEKKDWISFQTYESVGIGIANTKSFIRVFFKP